MSQYVFGTLDPAVDTGTSLATKLNGKFPAADSTNSGSSAPTDKVAGMYWYDTSGGATAWILKVYDGANWVDIGTLNTTAHTWTPVGGGSVTDFTDLGDVPSSYSGQGGKAVTVAPGEDELLFTDIVEPLAIRDVDDIGRFGYGKSTTSTGITRPGESGYLHATVRVGNYIIGVGNDEVRKLAIGTLTNLETETLTNAKCICTDGTHVYVGTGPSKSIVKYDPEDLSTPVATLSSLAVNVETLASADANGTSYLHYCDDNAASILSYTIVASTMSNEVSRALPAGFTTAGYNAYVDNSVYFIAHETSGGKYHIMRFNVATLGTSQVQDLGVTDKPNAMIADDTRRLWIAGGAADIVYKYDIVGDALTNMTGATNPLALIKYKDILFVSQGSASAMNRFDTVRAVEMAHSGFSTFTPMVGDLIYDGINGFIHCDGGAGTTNRYTFFG